MRVFDAVGACQTDSACFGLAFLEAQKIDVAGYEGPSQLDFAVLVAYVASSSAVAVVVDSSLPYLSGTLQPHWPSYN